MAEEVRGSGPLPRVPSQEEVEERLEVRRHAAARSRRRGGQVPDDPHGSQWRLVKERRLPVYHLHKEDAQGPDVDLCAVLQPRNNLRQE